MGSNGRLFEDCLVGYASLTGYTKDQVANLLGVTRTNHHNHLIMVMRDGWLKKLWRSLRGLPEPPPCRTIVGELYDASGGKLELQLDGQYQQIVRRAESRFGKLRWQKM